MAEFEMRFGLLCKMLDAISRSSKSAMKKKHFLTFIEHLLPAAAAHHHQKRHQEGGPNAQQLEDERGQTYFAFLRLLLPELDRERPTYGLRESALGRCLADALGLARDSEHAHKLEDWRSGGRGQHGINAGKFVEVAGEVLKTRQRQVSAGLSIAEVNSLLDDLAAASTRDAKAAVVQRLVLGTNTPEMKWILSVILKSMRFGMSEKTILRTFHPDAEDLFNVTCDLKGLCYKLSDRRQRAKRQDIEPGSVVRPQLASRVATVEGAWKRVKPGHSVVVECKFDGDRIQLHRNGDDLHFFSRNFIDHDEYIAAFRDVLLHNIIPSRCILDGEMLVWDSYRMQFVEFGSNQTAAKGARDGSSSSDLQLCYVAFDILYSGDTSVIHLPLSQRQAILKEAVAPLDGRLQVLLPSEAEGMNASPMRMNGSVPWSIAASSLEEIQCFFLRTVDAGSEGIVVKLCDSKWDPGDRSSSWAKIKPDYVQTGSDLDLLIIGAYYGSGRRGGEVSQFLLAAADVPPSPKSLPDKFVSMCRVGGGFSDQELTDLRTKLAPILKRNGRGDSPPPSQYVVTNHAKERPDVWITDPAKSVVLQVRGDVRVIQTEVFAAPYSLRFPRVEKIRYDKPWHDILSIAELVRLVAERSSKGVFGSPYRRGVGAGGGRGGGGMAGEGTTEGGASSGADGRKQRRKAGQQGGRKSATQVPSFLRLPAPAPPAREGALNPKPDGAELTGSQADRVGGGSSACVGAREEEGDRGGKQQRAATTTPAEQPQRQQQKTGGKIFQGCVFYFASLPAGQSPDRVRQFVQSQGGSLSLNLTKAVTHCIAASSGGWKFKAAQKAGDVVSFDWFQDSLDQHSRLPLKSKYFLHMSEPTKQRLGREVDEFGDSFFDDVSSASELTQLFSRIDASQLSVSQSEVDKCHEELCHVGHGMPSCLFSHCIFFTLPQLMSPPSGDDDAVRPSPHWQLECVLESLALQRSQIEMEGGGGQESGRLLPDVTHVLVPRWVKSVWFEDMEGAVSSYDELLSPSEMRLLKEALVCRDTRQQGGFFNTNVGQKQASSSFRGKETMCGATKLPRIVTSEWVEECVRSGRVYDEEEDDVEEEERDEGEGESEEWRAGGRLGGRMRDKQRRGVANRRVRNPVDAAEGDSIEGGDYTDSEGGNEVGVDDPLMERGSEERGEDGSVVLIPSLQSYEEEEVTEGTSGSHTTDRSTGGGVEGDEGASDVQRGGGEGEANEATSDSHTTEGSAGTCSEDACRGNEAIQAPVVAMGKRAEGGARQQRKRSRVGGPWDSDPRVQDDGGFSKGGLEEEECLDSMQQMSKKRMRECEEARKEVGESCKPTEASETVEERVRRFHASGDERGMHQEEGMTLLDSVIFSGIPQQVSHQDQGQEQQLKQQEEMGHEHDQQQQQVQGQQQSGTADLRRHGIQEGTTSSALSRDERHDSSSRIGSQCKEDARATQSVEGWGGLDIGSERVLAMEAGSLQSRGVQSQRVSDPSKEGEGTPARETSAVDALLDMLF